MEIPDLSKLVDLIPFCKELKTLPSRIETLEKRIAEIEEQTKTPQQPVCPYCWQGRQLMTGRSPFPQADNPHELQGWKCQNPACGIEEQQTVLLVCRRPKTA